VTLVFAYGSNLDAEDFRAWCERHGHRAARLDKVTNALLPDRCLSFERHSRGRGGGVLTLSPRLGHHVEGVLFEANEAGLEALDAKEGHPHAYERAAAHALLPDGRAVECLVYDVPPSRRDAHVEPSAHYLAVVARGLAALGSRDAALRRAAQRLPPEPLVPWLFVYGTLLAGEANAGLLDGLPRRRASVAGALHGCGPYPAMALGSAQVWGELVPLDPVRLPELDRLEGALPFGAPGGHYRRTALVARDEDGRETRAQVYVVDDASAFPAIESGDWRSVPGRLEAWAAYAASRPAAER
jgi:gamma-glutamylcyclotransferase (GGCT)/AIG2-like uncharacterized protein YtfP